MIKKIVKYTLLILFFSTLVIAGYFYYHHNKLYPTTDDAYVQADVVRIAPEVSGQVNHIYVQNQQYVKQGQLLFSIDPMPFTIALKKTQAALESIQQEIKVDQSAVVSAQSLVQQRQAELIETEKSTRRTLTLLKTHLVSVAAGDQARSKLKITQAALTAAQSQLKQSIEKLGKPGDANAQIREAKAAIAQARLNLSYTQIRAPHEGYLAKFDLEPGATVNAYQQVFALVYSHSWSISANFKETDLARIHPGQPVTITLDLYPDHVFKGTVSSIASGSGASFALLPPENATGNWVKVTQRFPVKITLQNPGSHYPLRLGASATVKINTTCH